MKEWNKIQRQNIYPLLRDLGKFLDMLFTCSVT